MYDVPYEVSWVYLIYYLKQPVGSKTIEKIDNIIDKYPEYFEWEHKYKSIPKEVHDAFSKECYPDRWIDFNEWELATKGETIIKPNKGIMEEIKATPIKPLTVESFDKLINDLYKIEQKRQDKEEKEHERVKAIWDKHYSKYKLKYRK